MFEYDDLPKTRYVNVDYVCKRWGISESTFRRNYRNTGMIPIAIKGGHGRKSMVETATIAAFENKRSQESHKEARLKRKKQ